jgi:hypothetical protein
MVAKLRCQGVSNLLQFSGATFSTMTMVVRQQSPRILERGKTAIVQQPPQRLW